MKHKIISSIILIILTLLAGCGGSNLAGSGNGFTPPSGPATITSFSPGTGPRGTLITINGTNFNTMTNTISIGNMASPSACPLTAQSQTNTQIVAMVPSGCPSGTSGLIYVNNGMAPTASSATTFTVTALAAAPTLSNSSPTSGVSTYSANFTYYTGTTVVLTGTNFGTLNSGNPSCPTCAPQWPRVYFNGSAYTIPRGINNGTQILVGVPIGATTGNVYVQTLDGSSGAIPFTVTGAATTPPTVTSFTPASGTATTSITLTGTNFDPVAANNLVYMSDFSGTPSQKAIPATVTSATATQLTITVPNGLNLGNNIIIVSNSKGSGWLNQPFNVQ